MLVDTANQQTPFKVLVAWETKGKINIRTYSGSRRLSDEITHTRTVLEAFGLSVNNLKLSHNCKVAVRFKEHIRLNKSTR